MKNRINLVWIFLAFLLIVNSCSEEETDPPCDNNGTICFTNKTDSAVQISIIEAHDQFTLLKDHIKCAQMEGKKVYKINVVGRNLYKDTTMSIQVCDEKDFIVKK